MARGRLTAGLLAMAALAGTAATAQTPAPQASAVQTPSLAAHATVLPDVTVTAPRFEQVPDLIQKFGVPDSKGRLARWIEPVCPAVGGLPDEMDALIAQRIRDTAAAVNIPVDRAGCAANILVLITPQPRLVTTHLIRKRGATLGGDPRWPLDRFKAQALIDSTDPVRLWYTSSAVQTSGGKAFDSGSAKSGLFGPETFYQVTASRLTPPSEEVFRRVVLVVDANRIVGFDLEQISAYVAMLSLAQANPKADMEGVSSILTLFSDQARGVTPPHDLTFWDRAYLTGLYDTDAQVNFAMQRSHIATHIRHDVAEHDVLALADTKAKSPPN